jgi:hypothetical protein
MARKTIESAFTAGLKTSINRFRERPLLYFTEADIQSYLHLDLMKGNSDVFSDDRGRFSLIHREYPSNFRCVKQKLLMGYSNKEMHDTLLTNRNVRGRAHYDLVLLKPEFVEQMRQSHANMNDLREQINNKCVAEAIERNAKYPMNVNENLLYVVEVKYLHKTNVNKQSMLDEILMDNEKLRFAMYHSNSKIRPINLIFCSSLAPTKIKEYVKFGRVEHSKSKKIYQIPNGVLNVYIESYFDQNNVKQTTRKEGALICYYRGKEQWALDIRKALGS